MTQYWGRVSDGVVAEIIALGDDQDLATLFVPELVVTMHLGSASIRQGWTWDGSVFAAPVAPGPDADTQLAVRLQAGIAITSTTTALNGTYALDPDSQANITGIIALLGAGQAMPQDPLPYPDTVGAPHMFTPDNFKAFATAVSGYVFALRTSWALLKADQSPGWPTLPVSIG